MIAAVLLLAGAAAGARAAGPDYRALVERTTASCTVSASVGPLETPLSPDWSAFLLDHPDAAAALVRRYKLARYRITMRGPRQSWADDGEGTQGLVTEVERGSGRRVYYAEGTHQSRLFPTIHASAVIVMDLAPVARPGCPDRVRSAFTVYVKLRNPLLSGMAKVLRPFVRDTVIRKLSRAFAAADGLGRRLAETPREVAGDLLVHPGLTDEDRGRIRALSDGLSPQSPGCLAPKPTPP